MPVARAAREFAGDIAIQRAGDAGLRQQIDSMLASEPWEEVAQFASYCVQGRMLGLQPWPNPLCVPKTLSGLMMMESLKRVE